MAPASPRTLLQRVNVVAPVSPKKVIEGGNEGASSRMENRVGHDSMRVSHRLPKSPPDSVHGQEGGDSDTTTRRSTLHRFPYVGNPGDATSTYRWVVERNLVIPDFTWEEMDDEERHAAAAMARSEHLQSRVSHSTATLTDRLLDGVTEKLNGLSVTASQITASAR